MAKTHLLPKKTPAIFGAKRKGQNCVITIDSTGAKMTANFIGSGRFTTAFRAGPHVILYTFYGDHSKSVLAQTWYEYGKGNPYLPRITRIGQIEIEGQTAKIYRAKYYNRVIRKYLSPENERIVTALQEAQDDACHEFPDDIVRSNSAYEFNRVVSGAKGLPESLSLALEHLTEVALDWEGHYIFDNFRIRNLGLDGRGRLVLIDPMFPMDLIQRDHDYRKRMGDPEYLSGSNYE